MGQWEYVTTRAPWSRESRFEGTVAKRNCKRKSNRPTPSRGRHLLTHRPCPSRRLVQLPHGELDPTWTGLGPLNLDALLRTPPAVEAMSNAAIGVSQPSDPSHPLSAREHPRSFRVTTPGPVRVNRGWVIRMPPDAS